MTSVGTWSGRIGQTGHGRGEKLRRKIEGRWSAGGGRGEGRGVTRDRRLLYKGKTRRVTQKWRGGERS